MAAFANPLWFGTSIHSGAKDFQSALATAQMADDAGLDYVAIQDHPYNPELLDTWTLLATIGAKTRRIRLFSDVANVVLRSAAIVAKTASSLDILSGGRMELGLGAGFVWDGITSLGGAHRRPGEAVAALEEAVHVMRSLWEPLPEADQGGVSFQGKFYQLNGAKPGPMPAHPIRIWIGAYKPKMLNLTGRLAGGWIASAPFAPPEAIPQMQAAIDQAAIQAGREPSQIRRGYNLAGTIQSDDAGPGQPSRPNVIVGSPAQWIDRLAYFIRDLRLDAFTFTPIGDDPEYQVRRFATQVVPALRQLESL